MPPARRTLVTEEAYRERERERLDKHELIQGEIVAMPGGSPKHNAIGMNLGRALGNRLVARRCLVFSSDQRLHVEATGLYTYADVLPRAGLRDSARRGLPERRPARRARSRRRRLSLITVASPGYLALHPVRCVADLAERSCLVFSATESEWTFTRGDLSERVSVSAPLSVRGFAALLHAA
jgi:hypothetical protein